MENTREERRSKRKEFGVIYIIVAISLLIFAFSNVSRSNYLAKVRHAPIVKLNKPEDIIPIIENMYDKDQKILRLDVSDLEEYYEGNSKDDPELVDIKEMKANGYENMPEGLYPVIRIQDGSKLYHKFIFFYKDGKLMEKEKTYMSERKNSPSNPGDKSLKYRTYASGVHSPKLEEALAEYSNKYTSSRGFLEFTKIGRLREMDRSPILFNYALSALACLLVYGISGNMHGSKRYPQTGFFLKTARFLSLASIATGVFIVINYLTLI